MILFIMRNPDQPDPSQVARASRDFAETTVRNTQNAKECAERWLVEAEGKFDEDTFSEARKLAAAEEKADIADDVHTHAQRKLAWEKRHGWREQIPVKPGAMPTPWTSDLRGWLRIFKNRIR